VAGFEKFPGFYLESDGEGDYQWLEGERVLEMWSLTLFISNETLRV
jgi:hypothetical protein